MRQVAVFVTFFTALPFLVSCSTDSPKQPPKTEAKEHGLSQAQAAEALVKIGDRVITVGDFADRLAEKSPYLRARYSSPERRREFLDELVKFELLAIEAEHEGLMHSPSVERTRKQVMIQQMMKAEFEDKVKLSDITDEEIKAYYDAHPEEFHKPEQVRASQIVIANEAQAKKVLARVKDSTDNRLFRKLASEQSIDTDTAGRGGDLQFFSRPSERQEGDPEVPDAVAEAAFTLTRVGEVYPALIHTDEGYHIVKLTGRRRALARSLDHARRPIQNRLWRQKRDAAIEQFVSELEKKSQVEVHWDRLQGVGLANDAPQQNPKPGEE